MTHDENRISDLIDAGSYEKSAIDRAKYELHLRRRAAIEEAAQRKWEEDQATNPTPVNPHAYVYGFKAGAQTILDNYHDYRLQSMEKYKNMVSANVRLGAENQRLREQLMILDKDFCHLSAENSDLSSQIEGVRHDNKILRERVKELEEAIEYLYMCFKRDGVVASDFDKAKKAMRKGVIK